ncbi:nuclear transport factor 2 family protein [Aurantiacibacter rhizosphaerae]|uniref:SnoaL-like domain-containing protein n=1 Tax=Aurantiacibacter rhizosphaerae TaxID=2691582 RepID=A0A844XGY3_9SPHN|nr:nuclear transport factor 2 family protein [Aurantiacibacter rhizosphaerae]MWV29276.1 hypothetical protein [Aurantiacibacter rhizosphaerae]
MVLLGDVDSNVDQLLAKQEITEGIYRWARGADRVDLATMQSAFHADATINYGPGEVPCGDFLQGIATQHAADFESTRHIIFNVLIDIDGDRATSEAGVDCRVRFTDADGPREMLVLGRYFDRWERRDGRWKIGHRFSVLDSYRVPDVLTNAQVDEWTAGIARGSRDETDPSYNYIQLP